MTLGARFEVAVLRDQDEARAQVVDQLVEANDRLRVAVTMLAGYAGLAVDLGGAPA